MRSEEVINKFIRDVVDLLVLVPGYTVKAKQKDAPRPIGSYADVDFVSAIEVGTSEYIYEDRYDRNYFGLYDNPQAESFGDITDPEIGGRFRSESEQTTNLKSTIQTPINEIYSINFYRDNAVDNARNVSQRFKRESIQEMLKEATLGLIAISDVREISEPLETGWEERAQFDITLNFVGSDEDIISAITSLDISAHYEMAGLVYNFNVEI